MNNIPRMRKQSEKRNIRVNPTTSVATWSVSSWEPTSNVSRGATSCSQEETSSTTRTAIKQRNTSACAPQAKRHSTHAANLIAIQIVVKTIQKNLTTPHLLRPISPRSFTLSSVPFLRKATAQGITARMFHILVSRLANWFFCMYSDS